MHLRPVTQYPKQIIIKVFQCIYWQEAWYQMELDYLSIVDTSKVNINQLNKLTTFTKMMEHWINTTPAIAIIKRSVF